MLYDYLIISSEQSSTAINPPMTCRLTLNRLQKSEGRMWKQTFKQELLAANSKDVVKNWHAGMSKRKIMVTIKVLVIV